MLTFIAYEEHSVGQIPSIYYLLPSFFPILLICPPPTEGSALLFCHHANKCFVEQLQLASGGRVRYRRGSQYDGSMVYVLFSLSQLDFLNEFATMLCCCVLYAAVLAPRRCMDHVFRQGSNKYSCAGK